MYPLDDTIAAIATAPGVGGLAVVRVSGREAVAIADRVFAGRAPLAAAATHTLHHGWARAPRGAGALDEVVAAVFRAPASYTGEDVVELSCHGGRLPARAVLDALRAAGARLAGPGEFTLRAFLNGKLDLAQAEAVADLIHADTERARELAVSQLAGDLSRALATLADDLVDALAEIEARVDFAEDVGGVEVPAHVVARLESAHALLDRTLAGAAWARAVREGVRVPIVGRPNAGKSSVFNALLGEARAIVAAAPGTTRDRVSERIEVAGIPVTLSDTAGLRAAADPVEAEGVARAERALDEGRAVIWVIDGTAPLAADDRATAARLAGKRVLVALNKRDLGAAIGVAEIERALDGAAWCGVVETSAVREHGVDALRASLVELLEAEVADAAAGPVTAFAASGVPEAPGAAAVRVAAARSNGTGLEVATPPRRRVARSGVAGAVANPRHVDALDRARAALDRGLGAARSGAPGELVAADVREAVGAIGEVLGRSVGADVLDRIFARFCIGK